MSLYETGIRPAFDKHILKRAAEKRNYGQYWSASSAGYCMRKNIFDRLGVPKIETDSDGRKQRVFEAGHIFHEYMQRITKEAGLSIAQEIELQDEELMIRGHIDDLVLIEEIVDFVDDGLPEEQMVRHLILYDYKTQNSRAFTYQKSRAKDELVQSHYHKMQLGTYMYMLRNGAGVPTEQDHAAKNPWYTRADIADLTEARILKISKDDLRQSEEQLLWTPALEQEVVGYWRTLNGYWQSKTMPKCTCADHEGGFLAKEQYNGYFYDGEPCSLKYYQKCKSEGLLGG